MADLSEKQFLDELEAITAKLRQEIRAKQLGLDSSPGAIAKRRKRVLLDNDFEFFAYTYFPHHIRGTPSYFQKHFCKRVSQLLAQEDGAIEWWVAPRGEAKSSLASKILPVFCAVRALLERAEVRNEIGLTGERPPFIDYILFLGAETRLPTKLMEIAKTELQVNENLAMDFPEVMGRGKVWKHGEAMTKTGVKYEARGAEQAVRGATDGSARPKLLIPDDVITDKEAKSLTERNNRWTWIESCVEYLGPPDGSLKCLGVGTLLHKDCPISRAKKTIGHIVHHFKAIIKMPDNDDLWQQCESIMRNDDLRVAKEFSDKDKVASTKDLPSFKFYLKHKKKMEKGAITSWPSVRSLYWLMQKRAKSKKAFGTEMQGDTRNEDDAVFTKWNFWVQRLQHWIYFAACDPSMGKGESSDPSAIIVGGWDTQDKKLNVIEANIKRRVPSKLSADLITMQKEFNCQGVAFENNNAYEHMRTTFIKDALDKNISLPLVGVTATVSPEVRIDSIEPFVTDIDPRILFHPDLLRLLEELADWPEKQSHHHYDGLTALHLLWMIAVSRGGGLPKVGMSRRKQNHFLRGYD